jgi:SprT protein
MNEQEFEIAIEGKVATCIKQANAYFDSNINLPNIRLNQKGSAAGTAYLQRHEVRFNFDMFKQDPAEFVNTVVPHEIAHLFVYKIYGPKVKPHGLEWQSIMVKVFGLAPNRTHTFAVKPANKSFLYQCECSEHSLTIRRHNKILKGGLYQCRSCKATLKEKQRC